MRFEVTIDTRRKDFVTHIANCMDKDGGGFVDLELRNEAQVYQSADVSFRGTPKQIVECLEGLIAIVRDTCMADALAAEQARGEADCPRCEESGGLCVDCDKHLDAEAEAFEHDAVEAARYFGRDLTPDRPEATIEEFNPPY